MTRRSTMGLVTCLAGALALVVTARGSAVTMFAPSKAGNTNAPADGTFVGAAGHPTIYVMQNGVKRPFSDWETYLRWGGTPELSNVVQLSIGQLSAIPVGDNVATGIGA